jgi:endonuclease YncB( thermonuclease family)
VRLAAAARLLLAVVLLGGSAPRSAAAEEASFDARLYRFIDWTVPHRVDEAVVQYVYDGDTLQDRYQRRIRLLGVNTPEVAHPEHGKYENDPGGITAMNYTEKTVRGKSVLLVVDADNPVDRYGRTLAVVFVRDALGRWFCLNWELVRLGHAEALLLGDNRLCRASEWRRLEEASRRRRARDFQDIASSYVNEGRPEGAKETYQEAIRLFPDARSLYESLGSLYLDLKLPGFSVDVYLAYLERHPDDVAVRYRLAVAYERMAAETGAITFSKYKKKAAAEWEKLLGTDYDRQAREHIVLP